MEIETLTPAAAQPANSSSSLSALSKDLDNFLTILTTQLQYQDPLSPLEANEFTNQLVLFAGVEQQIQQNRNMEDMIALQQNNVAIGAVSYLGQNIEATGRTAMLTGGQAQFAYTLPGDASSATLTILGPDGKAVFAGLAQRSAGQHEFQWDGKNVLGQALPEGPYTIAIAAKDAAGEAMEVKYSVSGRVTGVALDGDAPTLSLGDVTIPLSQVTRIREASGGSAQ